MIFMGIVLQLIVLHKQETCPKVMLLIVAHKSKDVNMDNSIKNKKIGIRLRSVRKQAGLTQAQTAKILGIETSTYTKIETGVNQLTVPHCIALAERFNISLDALILGKGEIKEDEQGVPEIIRLARELEENDPVMKFQIISRIYELMAEREMDNRARKDIRNTVRS